MGTSEADGKRTERTERVADNAQVTAEFAFELNDLLAATYGSIDELESKMLQAGHGLEVSVSEGHLVEAVGRATLHKDATISVSQIAAALGIRVPSATAAVNRLVKKGLLAKERSAEDARRVNVTLTSDGEKVYRLHAIFHRRMAEQIAGDMSPEEREVLLRGIRRLEHFYAQTIEELSCRSA